MLERCFRYGRAPDLVAYFGPHEGSARKARVWCSPFVRRAGQDVVWPLPRRCLAREVGAPCDETPDLLPVRAPTILFQSTSTALHPAAFCARGRSGRKTRRRAILAKDCPLQVGMAMLEEMIPACPGIFGSGTATAKEFRAIAQPQY